jgi:ABC-type glutathione transport system ATPase component
MYPSFSSLPGSNLNCRVVPRSWPTTRLSARHEADGAKQRQELANFGPGAVALSHVLNQSGVRDEGVAREYRSREHLSLSIDDGELLVLAGPSGCGKTTLLRSIGGLEGPTAGRIVIRDNDVSKLPPGARDLAMVFQNYALYPAHDRPAKSPPPMTRPGP